MIDKQERDTINEKIREKLDEIGELLELLYGPMENVWESERCRNVKCAINKIFEEDGLAD